MYTLFNCERKFIPTGSSFGVAVANALPGVAPEAVSAQRVIRWRDTVGALTQVHGVKAVQRHARVPVPRTVLVLAGIQLTFGDWCYACYADVVVIV